MAHTLLLTIACGGDPADPAATSTPATEPPPGETAVDDPSPWIFEEEDPPEAQFDAEGLAEAVGEALVAARTTTGAPVLDAYRSAMAGQGTYCPSWYAGEDGSTYWFDYCTSEYGASFNGYAFTYDYVDFEDGSGYIYNGGAVFAAATITSSEGYTLAAAGTAYDLLAAWPVAGEAHHVWYTVLEGSFTWDGPEAAGTWLEGALTPDLEVQFYQFDDYPDIRLAIVTGGLTGLEGSFDTVVFDDVVLWDEALTTSGCEAEPSGAISIRSPDGEWYDVLYDGPASEDAEVVPGTCDGCGTAWYRGEEVGSVCTDFSSLIGWAEAPW